jgi:hypothetical protein
MCWRCFSSSLAGWQTHNQEALAGDMRRMPSGLWGSVGWDMHVSSRGIQGQNHRGSCSLMLLAQLSNEKSKQRVRSGVSTHPDFLIQLSAIPAAGPPAFQNVGLVRIEEASAIRWPTAFRKGFCDQKPMHRLARQLQAARNLPLGERLLVERADGDISGMTIGATDLRWRFFRR